MTSRPVLLRAAGVAVLLSIPEEGDSFVDGSPVDGSPVGAGLAQVLHWGADPGALTGDELARLVDDLTGVAVGHSAHDLPWPLTLLPGEVDGWSGRPGLAGDRDGGDVFPRWTTAGHHLTVEPDGAQLLQVEARAEAAGLALTTQLRLEPSGLLRLRHTITNTGRTPYRLGGLAVLLPVPDQAGELLELAGRWCRERSPQRSPFWQGSRVRESRRGRTGHDATLLMLAGVPGFGFGHGEVWGTHVAWSGNHLHLAERFAEGAGSSGAGVIGGGELLLPGEVPLAPGEQYTSPWVVFSYSATGLDGVTARLHRHLRARPNHPQRPRPLVLNTWEAVYFDHDLERLTVLARRAAEIGVERFVLDDGWFGARRHDRAGLGDWYVSPDVWPDGLRPLADRVRELGMEFGLWFEPEMVNVDSDLVRAHPDWVLGPSPRPGHGTDDERLPRPWRHQYVLDLAVPQAYDYLLERIDALVREIGVAYIKWDHNRDLHESLHAGPDGVRRPGVHTQTLALYRLLDELRQRNAGLEIEACSSGGARVDLGILEHTDRVWASDTNDALERQLIQRWTGLLVPPELVGSHVGPPRSHTTARIADLGFRLVTALFGHAGIEWDVTTCTPDEVVQLQRWAAFYKEQRALLHSGDVVRADLARPDGTDHDTLVHGVVAADRGEAIFALVRLTTSAESSPGRVRLPGLDPQARYEVLRCDDAGVGTGASNAEPTWWQRGRATATGAVLASVGLPAPLLHPAQAVVLHVRRLPA